MLGFGAAALRSKNREAQATDRAILTALESLTTRLEVLEHTPQGLPVRITTADAAPDPFVETPVPDHEIVALTGSPSSATTGGPAVIEGGEPDFVEAMRELEESAVADEVMEAEALAEPEFRYEPGPLLFGYSLPQPVRGESAAQWGAFPGPANPFVAVTVDRGALFRSTAMRGVPELSFLDGAPHGLLWSGYLSIEEPGSYAFFAEFHRKFKWGGAIVRLEGEELFRHFEFDQGDRFSFKPVARHLEPGHYQLEVWLPWAQGRNADENYLDLSWRAPGETARRRISSAHLYRRSD